VTDRLGGLGKNFERMGDQNQHYKAPSSVRAPKIERRQSPNIANGIERYWLKKKKKKGKNAKNPGSVAPPGRDARTLERKTGSNKSYD